MDFEYHEFGQDRTTAINILSSSKHNPSLLQEDSERTRMYSIHKIPPTVRGSVSIQKHTD